MKTREEEIQENIRRSEYLWSEIEKVYIEDTSTSFVGLDIADCVDTEKNVLILGETGTGKELAAHLIHRLGNRREKEMVIVNVPALPESLIESELFGYMKGAFSGADRDRPGLFEQANGSTIFLDEIGDMPQALQPKLLRVIEQREFYPLGARKPIKSNFRVIAATNQDTSKIRTDLYYRLAQMTLRLPPLRENKANILALTKHFLNERILCKKGIEFKDVHLFWTELYSLLMYPWPGNVRELRGILEAESCGIAKDEGRQRLFVQLPKTDFMFDKFAIPPPIVEAWRYSWGYELVSFGEFDEALKQEETKYAEGTIDVSDEQLNIGDYVNALVILAKRLASKPKYEPVWKEYEKWKKENQFTQTSQDQLLKSSQEDITISRSSLEALLTNKSSSPPVTTTPSSEDAIRILVEKGIKIPVLSEKYIRRFLKTNPVTDISGQTLFARARQLGIDPKTLRKYLQKKEK